MRLSRSGSALEGSTTMALTAAAAPARKFTKLSLPAICRWADGVVSGAGSHRCSSHSGGAACPGNWVK